MSVGSEESDASCKRVNRCGAQSYTVKHMAKLVCVKCGHEEPVPMHCGKEMHVEGEQLVCWMGAECGHQDIPVHCGVPMEVR